MLGGARAERAGPCPGVTCPEAPGKKCAYAYNRALSGACYSQMSNAAATVGLFESDLGWNGSGGLKDLPTKPRHQGGDTFGFLDGHAKWFPRGQQPGLVWDLPPPGQQLPHNGAF